MVDSRGDRCCTCHDEPSACCSPHVFTSALLGALACVLMTGGVFLAFHKWDPLWLVVSAVGVVLVLVGSLLHCCAAREARRVSTIGPKGCCCRGPLPPDTHVVPNGGSLTEQLLPLSNARSVSQLSLNMLPGYFPPVVTTYGIEQHSAVVQNINRLVQQQQQQQQPTASPGSVNPSVANGKSFILLSLPGDTSQANIQNLVATVYQLDGNVVTEIPATDGAAVPTLTPATPPAVPVVPALVLKNAEVQTCNAWPGPVPTPIVNNCSQSLAVASTSAEHANVAPEPQPSTSSGTTQTEPLIPEAIDLMDCSPTCDTLSGHPDIPALPTNVLVPVRPDVLVSPRQEDVQVSSREDTQVSSRSNVQTSSNEEVQASSRLDSQVSSRQDIQVSSRLDIQGSSRSDGPASIQDIQVSSRPDDQENLPSPTPNDVLVEIPTNDAIAVESTSPSTSSDVLIDISEENTTSAPPQVPESSVVQYEAAMVDESLLGAVGGGSELSLSCDNLSDIEIDDGELMERSSPPPSYDDVTHEGLGYGTI